MTPLDHSPAWPPRGVTGCFVRGCVTPDSDPKGAPARARLGILQGVVSIVVNLVLFLVKGLLGLMLGSVALMADAVHSLSDIGTSLVVIFGFVWARKPRDSKHPFGHGRVEFVSALVIAVLLIVAAIEFAQFGISRIMNPAPYTAPWWAIIVVVLTMVMKQWLTVFAQALARLTGSQALKADYWHHLSDVMSTGLVLIALLASRIGWAGVDGWAGLGVSLFILYTGVQTARDAISPLLGEAPGAAEIRQIEKAARSVPGVRGVHDIILHKYGDDHLVSFHIEVDAGKTAMEVHDISERVEAETEKLCGGKAIVHVDPVDRSHPDYERAEQMMQELVSRQDHITEFHDLRVDGAGNKLRLSVDVVAVVGTKETSYPGIERRVREAILNAMTDVQSVDVTVETAYHNG